MTQIQVRDPAVQFTPDAPKRWLGGDRLGTLFVTSFQLLFPDGERFFVRSAVACLQGIDDERVREEVRAFAAQEVRHARAHRDFDTVLRGQGFRVEGIRGFIRAWIAALDRLPKAVRLAITAAAEHVTACLAEVWIDTDTFASAPPAMRRLFLWHAAEELEHKAVAYDLLRASGAGWTTRAIGYVVALFSLLVLGTVSGLLIFLQDRDYRAPQLVLDLARAPLRKSVRRLLRAVLLGYLRPGFHPDQRDNRGLIGKGLADAGVA